MCFYSFSNIYIIWHGYGILIIFSMDIAWLTINGGHFRFVIILLPQGVYSSCLSDIYHGCRGYKVITGLLQCQLQYDTPCAPLGPLMDLANIIVMAHLHFSIDGYPLSHFSNPYALGQDQHLWRHPGQYRYPVPHPTIHSPWTRTMASLWTSIISSQQFTHLGQGLWLHYEHPLSHPHTSLTLDQDCSFIMNIHYLIPTLHSPWTWTVASLWTSIISSPHFTLPGLGLWLHYEHPLSHPHTSLSLDQDCSFIMNIHYLNPTIHSPWTWTVASLSASITSSPHFTLHEPVFWLHYELPLSHLSDTLILVQDNTLTLDTK